jgi:uroporphyrinogen decarboxylase
MNARERYLASNLFGTPDRITFAPGWGRESTRARWYREGLPRDEPDIVWYAYRQAGGTLPKEEGGPGFHVNERMIPPFEEKVLERKAHSQVVQDWKGNICEIGLEYTVEYLRNAMDFVTRSWLKCPVESRADWEDMKRRYRADDPARYPAEPAALGTRLAARTWPIAWSFSGPFWQLREWLGFEGLCMLFHDDPDWVREMVHFWQEHVAGLLEHGLRHVTPDEVHLSEDMAYKEHAMISPAMTREFLLPCYRRWGEIVRRHKVPIYAMDSDGRIDELIPIWMEAGIQVCDPIEVAAGNDLVAFRRRFGRNMAYRGGVDKREMARGGRRIEAEIERLMPVIRDGGYVPGCDHAVPSDVSWPNYVHYVGLLAKATGWL